MSHSIQPVHFNRDLQLQDQVLGALNRVNSIESEIPQAMQRISAALLKNQIIFSRIPSLQPSGEILQLRHELDQSLSEYRLIHRACGQLIFNIDRLLSSMWILVCSPSCRLDARIAVNRQSEIAQTYADLEDCNHNLLSCMNKQTSAMVSQLEPQVPKQLHDYLARIE
jgi:hypothetical protein